MGTRGRWLHCRAVQRKAPADPAGTQRHRAGYAGIPAAPVRPRAAQPRCASGLWLHERHAGPAGRADRARLAGQPDRTAAGQAQRADP
ncbi:hypothetical protein G6F40_017792 [Rhizopus arrhizus]|nr:hypothetical protein G6F40_017792 [Rhizopus arrhizus]